MNEAIVAVLMSNIIFVIFCVVLMVIGALKYKHGNCSDFDLITAVTIKIWVAGIIFSLFVGDTIIFILTYWVIGL